LEEADAHRQHNPRTGEVDSMKTWTAILVRSFCRF
jgi:hypothetical protein